MTDALAHRHAGDRLMVIIGDRLSDLIRKGETQERYYNPGELFREVHLVVMNDDRPDLAALQRMVGGATVHVHNLVPPRRHFLRTAGWQFPLIKSYVEGAVALAQAIKPSLVRTHNNFIEGVMASEIKRRLGVPYVVSLHGVWDVDDRKTFADTIRSAFRAKLERRALSDADAVIAVYAPIVRYARAYGARRVELIYNVVAGNNIAPKRDYALGSPPRIVTINRQVPEKNPESIIRAASRIDCHYTLVGDGPLHERLRALAAELGAADRIRFVKSIPNAALCAQLGEFDVMASHCDYWGMSKTIIEGALAGLPIVINRHPQIPIEEYAGGWVIECENTAEGYGQAFADLFGSEDGRRRLGALARSVADERFNPGVMERRTVALYRGVLEAAAAAQ
jgi:glycosyltransferase involved in cell wall biosynthesis